jgi:hypothetical protein
LNKSLKSTIETSYPEYLIETYYALWLVPFMSKNCFEYRKCVQSFLHLAAYSTLRPSDVGPTTLEAGARISR